MSKKIIRYDIIGRPIKEGDCVAVCKKNARKGTLTVAKIIGFSKKSVKLSDGIFTRTIHNYLTHEDYIVTHFTVPMENVCLIEDCPELTIHFLTKDKENL